MRAQSRYHVCVFVTPWTVAHQALLSVEFSRQEYWSGLPFHFPGDLPHPGIEPMSLVSVSCIGRRILYPWPPEEPPLGYIYSVGFPCGSAVQNPPANAGDTGDADSIPELGRSHRKGTGHPPEYSCLENPTDRGAWWVTVHGVTESQT